MGKRIRNTIFNLVVWGAIVLLLGIAALAIFKAGPTVLKLPFYSGAAFIAAASLAIFLMYRLNVVSKINKYVFMLILIGITLIPRLLWIYFVQTQAFSDFLHMHNYGVNISHGEYRGFVDFYAVFPFKIGFGMVLGGLYAIFGEALIVAKLFNVTLSLILVLLLYYGGGMLYGEKSGRIAALLVAVWPAQIMYTSVVASEHLFLVLFVSAVLLILRFIKNYNYTNYEFYKGNSILVAIAVVTALAQLVRPMAVILLPVFAVFVLFFKQYRANIASSISLGIKSGFVLVVCYFAVINIINMPIIKATGVDVTRSDSGFNLMIGTNVKSNGMFNNEDFQIIKKNDYNFFRVHAEAKQIAHDRLKNTEPKQLIRLLAKKYEILWGNENYGYYWSTVSAGNSDKEAIIKSHPRLLYGCSQLFYIIIILMAILASGYSLREKRYDSLIILMIFGGIVLSYTLLEVQSRYHLPVMPLLILFGTGFFKDSKKYVF